MDANMETYTPMLTPEKLKPEFVNSREILVPNKKAKLLEESFLDRESTPSGSANRQESIECRSFLESDDCSESAPTDNVSEMSTSVKNYSTVEDDEGATPQFDEQKEMLGQESEDVVMEIAQRLSQLRSIGKTAESARKYILESDTGMEGLDSNDHHMSDLSGPKRLDFEVIDFDQFGAQPPDLPVKDNLMKVNHHGGKRAAASSKAKKPEHHVRVLNAHSGFEQEMKGLNDSPMKTSLKNTPEKKQLQKERGAGALDLPTGHVIPRLCNMVNARGSEGSRGPDASRDLDSNSIAGRAGNSKLRLLDSVKSKKTGEAPTGSPIRRSKTTMPDVKGSPVHEETRKRAEDLQQLTHMQAKRLEDYCNRVDLLTAQLQDQSTLHEELNRKLEAECGERLKSEAKLMVLCELLPNVDETSKNLCDQMLFMEVQLQDQVDLRNKLEEALERERQKRIHLFATLEEQVDLRNKLEDSLEQEHQERMHLAAILEEQVDFRGRLQDDLQQERHERMHLAAKLEEQSRLHEELAYKLEDERDERLKSEADLIVLREILPNVEMKLEDLNNQVQSLVAQLQEQTELREELQQKLYQEREQRMHHMAKMEDQTKVHEELAHIVEEERNERLKSGASLKHLHERLPKEEKKLQDLQNQVLSLTTQLQQQIELRKELEDRVQNAVMMAHPTSESLPGSSIPRSEENIEFAKLLDEQKKLLSNQVKEAELLKNATEKKVGLLDHQVENLEILSEIVETMEYAFSAREQAFRQTMWTAFQALCLGMGLMNFIVSCRNRLPSSLQPT